MANRIRYGVFHSVIGLGLLFTTPLFAQNPPSPPKVVDANGNFVGWPRTVFPSFTNFLTIGVERKINGVWVVIQAGPGGFGLTADRPFAYFLFTSADCSGNKYFDASVLPPAGSVDPSSNKLTLFFPGTPVRLLTIQSFRQSSGDQTCNPTNGPRPLYVGPAQSFNLNNLGLVPPFIVK